MYICIEREIYRERERYRDVCVCMCIHSHVRVYTYIYREREIERERYRYRYRYVYIYIYTYIHMCICVVVFSRCGARCLTVRRFRVVVRSSNCHLRLCFERVRIVSSWFEVRRTPAQVLCRGSKSGLLSSLSVFYGLGSICVCMYTYR